MPSRKTSEGRWTTRTSIFGSYTWQCGAGKRSQLGGNTSHFAFAKFSTRICVIVHTKWRFLRKLVSGTRWADYRFAVNCWIWWITTVTLSCVWLCEWTALSLLGCRHFTWTSPASSAECRSNSVQFLSCFFEKCECRPVLSHAGNISAKWVTSSSARFSLVPTGWNNCSHSADFHANPQGTISTQTHFSCRGHHLALPFANLAVTDYFLWGCFWSKVYGTRSASISDLKQLIQECIPRDP